MSVALRQFIEEEIRTRGPIPFSRYMELCLYGGPGGDPPGFYTRAKEQFGKAGDFYTSSDVHAVFGRLLARQFEEMWRALGSPERIDVVELGPGRGLFARDVLDWSARKFTEFRGALQYTLVEASPGLQGRLTERFASEIRAGTVRVVENISASPVGKHFVVFANEFFDALPVEVITDKGELRIAVRDGRLVETFAAATPAEMEFLDDYSVLPETGERVEATLAAVDYLRWIERAVPADSHGFLVFVDYGYTRQEQLAGRHRDTIMAFRQHSASSNPYEAPGEQDITAHVNFTALTETAREIGFEPSSLVTQAQFLMGIGEANEFADAFEDCRLPQERAKVMLQLKHLVTPGGMGETFQVLVISRDVAHEKVAQLAGLKFAR